MLYSIYSVMAVNALLAQSPAPQQAAPAPAIDVSCPDVATALQAVVRNDVRRLDWPNLARYREQNRTLAAPAAGDTRVVFMGDSITDNWQQPRFGAFFQDKRRVDRGIGGQTTPQMLIRFRPDVIELKPKVVVILAGTNDIAGNTGPMTDEEIERNIESMAELAKAHGIKVVLSSILPTSAYHAAPNAAPQTTLRPMARIKAINAWMKTYADANGHVYLDYFTPMLDGTGLMKAELTGDDLHPNPDGYKVMEPLVEAAIQRALTAR
jgi:lysophospholipase L1-like esterase